MQSRARSVAIVTLLLASIFFIIPQTKANDANTMNLTFASGPGPFSLPGGHQFQIYGGTWYTINDTGMEYFPGNPLSKTYGEGTFNPVSDIKNFTFTICFLHKKNTFSGGANELLASIGAYSLGLYPGTTLGDYISFFTIYFNQADSDDPILHFQVTDTIRPYSIKADAAGSIKNNIWYTLSITYSANLHTYYAYINGQYWSRGNWTWASSSWLSNGGSYVIHLGAWNRGIYFPWWENFFYGYMQYALFIDAYTTPFVATKNILWYHLDESAGTTVIDTSGNNFNGVSNSDFSQRIAGGKFGYAVSGSIGYYVAHSLKWMVGVPSNIPIITDKFSASYWQKVTDYGVSSLIMYTNMKTFRTVLSSVLNKFEAFCNIGGVNRELDINHYIPLDVWFYLYLAYDGSTFRFSVQYSNWTVIGNVSTTVSGTIADQSTMYDGSGYGFCGEESSYGSSGIVLDEIKLIHDFLPPYYMNSSSGIGTTNGSSGFIAYNSTDQIIASISPSTIVCNPTTDHPYGYGYATLTISSSGPWTVKLTDNASMFAFVSMTPSLFNIAAQGKQATVNLPIPIVFIANNLTTQGQIFTNSFTFSLTGNPFKQTACYFTVQIGQRTVPQPNQSSFNCYWSNAAGSSFPVNLYWSTVLNGHDILFARDKSTGLSIGVNVQSLGFDETPYIARGYNSTFVRYAVITPDALGYAYTFSYGIDSGVNTYGNFTVINTLKVTNKNNPNDYMIIPNYIYVYINHNVTTTRHIWCVVSPSTLTDYGNVTDQATLYLYANYPTKLFWSLTGQGGSGWETWYIHVYGSPAEGAVVNVNSSVALRVVLPSAIGSHTCTLTVHDFNDPSWTNYTTLTNIVRPPIPGIDFTFYISPLDVYFDMSKTVGTPHITGQLYCTNSHDFYLSIASTTQPPNGMTVSYPSHLGYTSSGSPSIGPIDISFNVNPTLIANGDYAIEFDAFYQMANGTKPFFPQVVKVHVINSHVTPTPPVTPVNPIIPNGTQIIQPTVTVPVEGYGSGNFALLLSFISSFLGWSIYTVGYLIGGILFMLIVLTGAVVAHQAPAVVHVGIMIFALGLDVILGLWPMWIAWTIVFVSAALLGWKVVGTFGGNKGNGD